MLEQREKRKEKKKQVKPLSSVDSVCETKTKWQKCVFIQITVSPFFFLFPEMTQTTHACIGEFINFIHLDFPLFHANPALPGFIVSLDSNQKNPKSDWIHFPQFLLSTLHPVIKLWLGEYGADFREPSQYPSLRLLCANLRRRLCFRRSAQTAESLLKSLKEQGRGNFKFCHWLLLLHSQPQQPTHRIQSQSAFVGHVIVPYFAQYKAFQSIRRTFSEHNTIRYNIALFI